MPFGVRARVEDDMPLFFAPLFFLFFGSLWVSFPLSLPRFVFGEDWFMVINRGRKFWPDLKGSKSELVCLLPLHVKVNSGGPLA